MIMQKEGGIKKEITFSDVELMHRTNFDIHLFRPWAYPALQGAGSKKIY